MMLAADNLTLSLRVATMVVPVAIYFLVLGLLNSRSHPQLLTGRCDFSLLILALSPVFVLPVLNYFGATLLTVPLGIAAVFGCVVLLGPRRALSPLPPRPWTLLRACAC